MNIFHFIVFFIEEEPAGRGQNHFLINKLVNFSIRAKLGKDVLKNSIHAALDEERAKAEIRLAFGDELEFDEEGKVKEAPENGRKSWQI